MVTLRTLFLLLLVSAALLGSHLSCKKTPTEPPNGGVDTTSHAFTFVLDTLGDGNSSVLNDVAIISENNVWAVGEVYLRDSTGQIDPTRYNLVQWDGTTWRYLRVLFPVCNSSGQEIGTFPFAATSIFAFSANDIWITSLGTVARWNGQVFQRICVPPGAAQGSFKKMWGHDGKVYLVGTNGNITYFSGSTWTKLTTGTTVDIQDIYGAVDARTGETEILAVASYVVFGQGLALLRINGTTVTHLDTAGLRIAQSSVWFVPGKRYYVVGDGVFTKTSLAENRWQLDSSHPLLYKASMRGSSWNDAFIVGAFGLVSHYNGSTFKHYTGVELPSLNGSYYSVRMQNNLVVAVGDLANGKTIVLRGKRP